MRRILIIDDEEGIRTSLSLILEGEGYRTRVAADAESALTIAREAVFDFVLCDVRMPGRDGLDVLPDLVAEQPNAQVLIMSAYGDLDQAIDAVRRGAHDYVSKPFRADELLLALAKAEERGRLRRENARLRDQLERGGGRHALVAGSQRMKELYDRLEQGAAYKTTILITGESGVGKEVAARTVHRLSPRADKSFIAVNCGAIPDTLIESELFGHSRGAFTGAVEEQLGLFREAHGGTLFLDEIGELPSTTQVTLLRTLQEEEVRPIGEPKSIPVDVRIVAATSRKLEEEVKRGTFRADLYYRLNVLELEIPPLRERPEDIPLLCDELLRSLSTRLGKAVAPIDEQLMESLQRYDWPGNIRELENSLERALILCDADALALELFPFVSNVRSRPSQEPTPNQAEFSIKQGTRTLEERLIRRALHETQGNRTQAALLLEISPRALQYKLKEYAVDPLNPLIGVADSGETKPHS